MTDAITPSDLHKLFRYDRVTGELLWKIRTAGLLPGMPSANLASWNAKHAGKSAGTKDGCGYLSTRIFGKSYKCHRIVWALVHGEWPADALDHQDHNRTNNRIENLRLCSTLENSRNQVRSKFNTSGVTGVVWNKRTQKWHARIGHKMKRKHLGAFSDFEDAVRARKAAEEALGYHPNHGILPERKEAA